MSDSASSFVGHAFASAPLDRADALRDDAEALARLWPDAKVLVLDADGTALADDAGQPFVSSGRALGGGPGAAIFLGMQQQQAWFVAEAATVMLQAPQRLDLRRAAVEWPAEIAGNFW